MDAAAIVERLRAALPDSIASADTAARDPWVQVVPADAAKVIRFLHDEPDLAFDSMMSLAGIDLTGLQETPDLRVVWHLFSYRWRHTLVVRADVPRDRPSVPSVVDIYPGANWHEREAFDLLGITFEGHPDLRRLLLPPEWEGHPLRKDYVQGDTVLGFPATRRTLLDELREAGEK